MQVGLRHIVPRTPPTITATIRTFAAAVVARELPVGLAYAVCEARRDSRVSECFDAVDAQVRDAGGSAVHGWAIWEHPGLLLEAEFHAVWCSPIGGLVDVVNREHDTRPNILFVPDPSRRCHGVPIDTVRHPLVDDPRMDEVLRASEEIFGIMNRGERATQRILRPSKAELRQLNDLLFLKAARMGELLRAYGSR